MPVTEHALAPALAAVLEELEAATRRLDALIAGLDQRTWSEAAVAGGWSPAQCVEHLNLTSERILPLLDDALQRGRAEGRPDDGRFTLDLFGRVLLWVLEPPYRVRVRTPAAFDPMDAPPIAETVARFRSLQERVGDAVVASQGLPLSRIRIVSPFDARVRYSVYSAFRIIPCHQRRHLWQAERIAGLRRGRG
jgi:hypothetical protein